MTKKKLFCLLLIVLTTVTISACVSNSENRITAEDLNLAPPPTPTGPSLFSFIVLGDNGNLNPVFETIIDEAEKSDASFVIHTGDITNGKSKTELTTAKAYLDKNLSKPYYVAIGDNDHMANSTGARTDTDFESVFGDTMQSFDYQNSHFVIFNSTDETNSFTNAELDWLESDLAKANQKFTFLIMHVPIKIPMSESLFGEPTAKMQKQNDRFTDIITKHEVDQIYTGHFHGYLNYKIDEIPVTVTGGAGSSPQFGFEKDYHYLQVSVYMDAFATKYQPVDSLSLD